MSAPIILIHAIERASRMVVRIALVEDRGRYAISVRNYFRDPNGRLRRSKAGLDLAIRHLPELADALKRAEERARSEGFLDFLEEAGTRRR